MKHADIIEDLMSRVKSVLGGNFDCQLDQIENEVRRNWSGATPYISKRNMKKVKESAIRKINSGLSVREVSEQSGLSISSIYIMLRRNKK